MSAPFSLPTGNECEFLLPHISPAVDIVSILGILIGVQWFLVVLIWNSPLANDMEHLHVLIRHRYVFGELPKSLAHFWLGYFIIIEL